jgi:FHA domain
MGPTIPGAGWGSVVFAEVLDPVAVGLKFGFIAVLYLFLFWMARSTLKDLRRGAGPAQDPAYADATGMHVASQGLGQRDLAAPRLRVETAAGLRAGAAYDLSDGALLGRGEQADIQLEDGFASTSHARLVPHGDVIVLEDLGSTNGTYLNGEPLSGPQPLHVGDKIRIGDSEFTFER